MARDSFEIYYYQDGRWSVHATFDANQRELALAQAQELETSLRVPVRLVRETFDPATNTSEEAVSWQSAKAKEMPDADDMFGNKAAPAPKKKPRAKPPAPPPRRKEPEETSDAPPAPAAKPKPKRRKKKKKGQRSGLTKLAIVVSMSLLMAVVVTTLVTLAIAGLEKLKVIGSDDRRFVVATVFLIAYVLSAIYQLIRQFELWRSWNFRRAKKPAPSAADMIRKMKAADLASTDDFVTEVSAPATEVPVEELREQIEQADAVDEADRLQEDDFATEVQTAEETPPQEEAAPLPPPEPAQATPPPEPPKAEPAQAEPPKVEKPPEKPVEKPPEKSPAETEAQKNFAAFVNNAVSVANQVQSPLNAMSRFGLNLYLAGACSTLGQAKKLGRMPQLTILRDGLQGAGNSRERAETFCAELPSHGKNARYAGMVQAGGQAMTRHLAGQGDAASDLTGLLTEWGRPEKRTAVPTEFTFLFTDLVGSTAMTSQLGNAGAQKVVRAHNTAVRGAIQAFGGREVKHTGDGIMATFPTPVAGVQAAIRMQKELVQVATSNPALNFSVRMGLNVGEAVEEDNDYFGGAVQMTARICAAASERNIWVSKAVVDACRGQRLGFIPRGAFQMKGIQQARPLYEVAYTEAHRNELANL